MNFLEYFRMKRELKHQYKRLFYMDNYPVYKREKIKTNLVFIFSWLILFLSSIFIFLVIFNSIQGNIAIPYFIIYMILFLLSFTIIGLLIFNLRDIKRISELKFFQNLFYQKLEKIGIKYSSDHHKSNPKFEFEEVPNTQEAQDYKAFINLIKRYLEVRSKIEIILSYWWLGNLGLLPILLVINIIIRFPISIIQFLTFFLFLNFSGAFTIVVFIILSNKKYLVPLGADVMKLSQPVFFKSKIEKEIHRLNQKV
ncbi:MAG: hypothetical protein EU550_00085 [Promethearchaeota archaeon]|nr:MAG: hypothetical protein EU550_00085 [Candidatus Lokiarchaeota archaeon]